MSQEWDAASAVEGAAQQRARAQAITSVDPYVPFLAAALSKAEFDHRLAEIRPRVASLIEDERMQRVALTHIVTEALGRQVVYQGTSTEADLDNNHLSMADLDPLLGKYVSIIFFNEHGIAADYELGRVTAVDGDQREFEWAREGAPMSYPVSFDSVYRITRLEEPVPAGQGLLFASKIAETHAPYKIEERGDKYVVVNDKGDVKGTHDTWDEARQHQKALYANVPGASEQAEKKHESSLEALALAVEALSDEEYEALLREDLLNPNRDETWPRVDLLDPRRHERAGRHPAPVGVYLAPGKALPKHLQNVPVHLIEDLEWRLLHAATQREGLRMPRVTAATFDMPQQTRTTPANPMDPAGVVEQQRYEPRTTRPRIKPAEQPDTEFVVPTQAPRVSPVPSAKPDKGPQPFGDSFSKPTAAQRRTARINQIAASIIIDNPDLPMHQAMSLAREVVKRYPEVAGGSA